MARNWSVLTTDITRNPSILQALQLEAWAASPASEFHVTEAGAVTTVTAVGS